MCKLFPPTENYFSCVEDTEIKLSRCLLLMLGKFIQNKSIF